MTAWNEKEQALIRAVVGGLVGMAAYLFLSWLLQPGYLFGASPTFDFTFCLNSRVPEALGAVLGFLLWFLFGVEIGIATLPFADGGRTLLLRSLAHFGAMALTLWAWVLLNFSPEPWPGLALTFLLPFTLTYFLIWLGRWVGWYAEVAQIREKLGLSPKPSFWKWRDTLPHMAYALVLCFLLPLLLRLCDAPDVPVLTGALYTWLLLPVGSFFSGLSLGRRQGVCPLYPLACGTFSALFALLLRAFFHGANEPRLVWMALAFSLTGNFLGAGMKERRNRETGMSKER